LEFKGFDDLDNLFTLAISGIFLILLVFSQRSLLNYKREYLRCKQAEQRLRDLIYDLRMRVKYQNEEINEILDSEQKVRQKAELLCNIAFDPICVFDSSWNFVQINNALIRLTGYSSTEITSSKFLDFFHPDERENVAVKTQWISKENPTSTFQNTLICKDGSHRLISWNIVYMPDQNIYVGAAVDLTARKSIEEMTVMLNDALRHEKIKNEFYSNLTHDLKTPLNVLISTQQLLKLVLSGEQPNDNKNIDRYLYVMKQNCFRLLRLVNNLADVSRIDSGFLSLNLANHNIVNIVEDVCLSVADYIKTRNIELIFDTSVEELIISCDPDKIERIILNILSNAVKFTDKGGLISVNMHCDTEYVTISLKDTGIGIPEEMIETIFQRFKQLDNTLSRNYGGSGIGLSLVKSLIEMHRGKIAARSQEGKGAEFLVSLPLNKIEVEQCTPYKENSFNHQNRVERITIEFSDIYVS